MHYMYKSWAASNGWTYLRGSVCLLVEICGRFIYGLLPSSYLSQQWFNLFEGVCVSYSWNFWKACLWAATLVLPKPLCLPPLLHTHTHTQPLHYAASQGNHQLVKLLVEANANPEMACNLGDTPASIAYSNNHMALSDWLENVTSSSKESGLVDSGLSPQLRDPLCSETNKDRNEWVQ